MIVSTRNEADTWTDPFSVSFRSLFNFFFVSAEKHDGDAIKSVGVKAILLDRVENMEVNAEKSLPFENGVAIQKTFAESNPCFLVPMTGTITNQSFCKFLKHPSILTEHLSVSKVINSIKHHLEEDRQNPFPEADQLVEIFEQKVLLFAMCTS